MSDFKKSYSQSGEDLIIDFLFTSMLGINDISYLDIGSNHPLILSNTYYFYEKGYSGVCVDPNPLFREAYKSLRPRDQFIVAGAGKQKGKLEFFEFDPHTLSTFSKESAKQFVEEDGHAIVNTYKVPVITPANILKRYFKNKPLPNYLNLDVEGLDIEILEGIDFKSWRPTVICVETVNYSTKKEQKKIPEIFSLFEGLGYFDYGDTFINTVFVDKNAWAKRRK